MIDDQLSRAQWRKSTFSSGANGGTECVEVAALDDGHIAMRNSKHPHDGVAIFTRAEMAAFVRGLKAGQFDDLV